MGTVLFETGLDRSGFSRRARELTGEDGSEAIVEDSISLGLGLEIDREVVCLEFTS